MLITISQRHIDRGEPCNNRNCAAALAITEAIPGSSVLVDADEVWIDNAPGDHVIHTPSTLADFIGRYDEEEPVEPLTFNLPMPDEDDDEEDEYEQSHEEWIGELAADYHANLLP